MNHHTALRTDSLTPCRWKPMTQSVEKFDDPLMVYFRPSQKRELEAFLRREHAGMKVGAWVRDVALGAMHGAAGAPNPDNIKLHLGEEDREQIMVVARELGHRDLAIFAEELLLRAAQRDPDEVIRFFRGKAEPPALSLVPPATAAPTEEPSVPMIEVRRLFDEMRERQQQESNGDAKSA